MNIFNKLNLLLLESESKSKKHETNDIPIHPEMETKEQGINDAIIEASEVLMNLKYGGGGGGGIDDGKPQIPNSWINPIFSENPEMQKDKTFKENKLVGWDEEPQEKIDTFVDVEKQEPSKNEDETPYDSFDYEDNDFDESGEDGEGESGENDFGESGEDGEGKSGGESGEGKSGGESGEGESSGNQKENLKQKIDDAFNTVEEMEKERNQDHDKSIGEQSKEGKEGEDGTDTSSSDINNEKESKSEIKKNLEKLKEAIKSGNQQETENAFEDIKSKMTEQNLESKEDRLPGGQIETPSDDEIKKVMKDTGYDETDIIEMNKEKNIDASKDINEEDIEKLQKEIADEIEKHSRDTTGTSSTSSSHIKNALEQKIKPEDWKKIIKSFLTKKIGKGGKPISKNNNGLQIVNKKLISQGIYAPTYGGEKKSKTKIKKIYCFVDCSGSIRENLVKDFLGLIINMFSNNEIDIRSTELYIYGFGLHLITTERYSNIVEETKVMFPIKIDNEEISIFKHKHKEKYKEVLLNFIWENGFKKPIQKDPYIQRTENFREVIAEINKIKRNDNDSVFLIFGDGEWCRHNDNGNEEYDPRHIREDISNISYLKDICILAYYKNTTSLEYSQYYVPTIRIIRQQGLERDHIITTKLSGGNLT